MDDSRPPNAVSVINNFFRDWGHQYIYDASVMHETLGNIGFIDIQEAEIGKSRYPELENLEYTRRMPEGFVELELFVLEAKKPFK